MNTPTLVVAIVLGLCSASTCAHQLSTAYFTGNLTNTGLLEGEWQVRLYDVERAVGIDTNGDGTLLWGELLAHREPVGQYLSDHLNISRGEAPCPLLIEDTWQVAEHFNEGYLIVPVRAQCEVVGTVQMHYSAFFAQDNEHKLLVTLKLAQVDGGQNDLEAARIISDSQRSISIDSEGGSAWATAQEFIVQGAIHIWKGLDHILFLISLLLTCVLVRANGRWAGRASVRDIVISTTWIVTAFTLAHSLTLTATALEWINFPSRWVEVGIAVSVIIAALNNIHPMISRLGWMTFAFGLLHGMGFAGVLGELGLPADQKVLTVLSFNIGVELGQLVVVAAVLPLLILVRKKAWYSPYVLFAASIAIAIVGVQWVIERV